MISFDDLRLSDRAPIYTQLVDYVRRGVASGALRDGEALPSRRALSALLGVNPNTVQKAYALLEEAGLLSSRSGAVSVLTADAAAAARIRHELVEEAVRAAAASFRELGLEPEQAAALLKAYWGTEESI